MKKEAIKIIVTITLTLIAAGFVLAANKAQPLKNHIFYSFPLEIGDWKGREIPMSEYVYQGIETPYLFLRDYYSPRYKESVNLSIVWFDDTNIAFHTPEYCLGGISNEVKEEGFLRIRTDEGKEYGLKKFITNLNGTDYLVLYFFDVDGFITTKQSEIRMHVLLKRLQLHRASASFVRLMAPVGDNEQSTQNQLVSFLKVILDIYPRYTYTGMVIDR